MSQINILIIEDDADDRLLITSQLCNRDPDLSVTSTGSHAEALELLESGSYSVIVSELEPNSSDTLAFLRRFRDSGIIAPCIIFTGRGDERQAVAALHAGASDYFSKNEAGGLFVRLAASIRHHAEAFREHREKEQLHEEYDHLLQQMRNAVIIFSPEKDGQFIVRAINRAACRIEGVSQESAIGASAESLFPGPGQFITLDVLRKVHSSGRTERIPASSYRDGRCRRWCSGVIYTLPSGNLAAVYDDVTAEVKRKTALEKSEARLRAIINNTSLGFYQTTREGQILFVNDRIVEILGYESQEALKSISLSSEATHASYEREEFQERLERDGHIKGLEAAWTALDGSTVYIRENARCVRDDEGNVLYYEGTIEDITDRKQAETALQKSEAQLRAIIDNTAIGFYQTSPDGDILFVNRQLSKLLGYSTAEELLQTNLSEVWPHPGYDRREFIERIERDGQIQGLEAPWTTRSGRKLFMRENARCVRDEKGNTLYYEGTLEDITQRKRTELALAKAEARFTELAGAIDEVFFLRTTDRLEYISPAFEEIFQIPLDDAYADAEVYRRVVHPDDIEALARAVELERVSQGSLDYEFRIIRPDGELRWINVHSYRVDGWGESYRSAGIVSDITEKKIEEIARDWLQMMQGLLSDGVSRYDLYAHAQEYLKQHMPAENMALALRDSRSERLLFEYNVSEKSDTAEGQVAENSLIARVFERGESILIQPDSRDTGLRQCGLSNDVPAGPHWVGIPLEDEAETVGVLALQGFHTSLRAYSDTDLQILDRMAVSLVDALKHLDTARAQRLLTKAVEQTSDATITHDEDGIVQYANTAAADMLQLNLREIVGQPLAGIIQCHDSKSGEVVKAPHHSMPTFVSLHRGNGAALPVEVSRSSVKSGSELFYILTLRDISERDRFLADITRKKEDLQQLAAELDSFSHAVSHDLRAPIRQLNGYLDLTERNLAESELDAPKQFIGKARSVLGNMQQIVDALLGLSRVSSSSISIEPVNVSELAEQVLQITVSRHRDTEPPEADIAPELSAQCDAGLLSIVLTNLFDNAIKYRHPDRRLKLKLDQKSCTDGMKVFCLKDNGLGLPEEKLEEVFKPFKRMHVKHAEGAGIGLSTVQRAIRRLGGSIRAERNPEHGLCILFSLPA